MVCIFLNVAADDTNVAFVTAAIVLPEGTPFVTSDTVACVCTVAFGALVLSEK